MLPSPWKEFLLELDGFAEPGTVLPCLGGFAVSVVYGLARPTADIDVIQIAPRASVAPLMKYGGFGSLLFKKHRVYLDNVDPVTSPPINYDQRLREIPGGKFQNINLFVFDPYDVALSKVKRDNSKDFRDVMHLAQVTPFDIEVLKDRYQQEVRPDLLGDPREADSNLQSWIDAIEDQRRSGAMSQTP